MSSTWVVNSSPLILLSKAGHEWLLPRLAPRMLIPVAVANEVSQREEGAGAVERLLELPNVVLGEPLPAPMGLRVWDLGAGETDVLSHCAGLRRPRAVIDDLKARRCSAAFGIPVLGSLGVVLRAKRAGLVQEAGPVVDRLLESGLYIQPELVSKALKLVDE